MTRRTSNSDESNAEAHHAPSNNAALGRRLRALRVERGLAQGEVARRLAISPAYLSLIEQGKRAMQLPLLFAALEIFGVPAETFMDSLGPKVSQKRVRLAEDPLVAGLGLGEEELDAISANQGALRAFQSLLGRHREVQSRLDDLMADLEAERASHDALRFDAHPFNEVESFLEAHNNFFPTLETRAEAFRLATGLRDGTHSTDLARVLDAHLHVKVQEVEEGAVLQRWDGKTLTVARGTSEARLRFRLARGIALRLFESEGINAALIEDLELTPTAVKLVKIHLANYFAGALLLPYTHFYDAAMETRYDVERLMARFNASYESVAHRLCNLGDPSRRGVPMHFVRVDVAGNITKRYAGDGVPLSRDERSCPKQVAHLAFLSPNTLTKQYVVYPDGRSYFTFAKVVSERRGGSVARGTLYAIGLGCRASDAPQLAYADDMPFADPDRMAIPVGRSCRRCERTRCRMRSAPSYQHAFHVDESIVKANFFAPSDNERKSGES